MDPGSSSPALRRCAFLTLADPADYVIDDPLAEAPLRELGWQAEPVVWNRPGVDWRAYDVVVIRTPWDYHKAPEDFIAVLEAIVATGTRLENDLELVRWNLDKSYLRDLESRGVPIVPTLWRDRLEPGGLRGLLEELACEQAVVKPLVSANAEGAFWLDRGDLDPSAEEVEGYFARRPLLAQPFVESVLREGECSLFYFNGEHSHTVRKTPKPRDFRVQEEHGGLIQAMTPDRALQRAGAQVLRALDTTPFQARADFVRANGGDAWWLMELELVEPSLYLRMDPEAPRRFARALDARWKNGPEQAVDRG